MSCSPIVRPSCCCRESIAGPHIGEDVTYSGTIAAAMEGTLLRVPSIALSQCVGNGHPAKWATAAHHAPEVIRRLVGAGWPEDVLNETSISPISCIRR